SLQKDAINSSSILILTPIFFLSAIIAAMGMLDRIKKKQLNGFKEFVQNMEITSSSKRIHIFMTGVLEDPIYMNWVMKNIKNFSHVLELSSEDLEAVLMFQEQMVGIFAKSIAKEDIDPLSLLPRLGNRVRDELSYLGDLSPQEIDSARFYMIKMTRKLQMEEKITGFNWLLPPQDVFFNKHIKDEIGRASCGKECSCCWATC